MSLLQTTKKYYFYLSLESYKCGPVTWILQRQMCYTKEYLAEKRKAYFLSQISGSVQFSNSVISDFFRPHGLQHPRLPCPSSTSRACSNSWPLSQWCHPTISSSVSTFSSCLQSCPASGYVPINQFFASGGQGIGTSASASVLPLDIEDRSPLGWTGWISLQSKGLSRVFSNTTVQKH